MKLRTLTYLFKSLFFKALVLVALITFSEKATAQPAGWTSTKDAVIFVKPSAFYNNQYKSFSIEYFPTEYTLSVKNQVHYLKMDIDLFSSEFQDNHYYRLKMFEHSNSYYSLYKRFCDLINDYEIILYRDQSSYSHQFTWNTKYIVPVEISIADNGDNQYSHKIEILNFNFYDKSKSIYMWETQVQLNGTWYYYNSWHNYGNLYAYIGIDLSAHVTTRTNIPFRVLTWLPDYSDEIKEYCESNIVVLDVSPRAPSVSHSDITISPSCPNIPNGKIDVTNITSFGDVRYLLLNGHNAVPGNNCASRFGETGELGDCLNNVIASGKANKTNGEVSLSLTGVPSGYHTLVLINPGGDLGVCYSTYNVTVESKLTLQNTSIETQPTSCYGSKDGVLLATFSGGELPIIPQNLPLGASYSTSTVDVETIISISGLAAVENGSQIFSDACGQEVNLTYSITSPPAPPVVSVSSATNASCLNYAGSGKPNGSVVLSLAGSAKYRFKAFIAGASSPFIDEETSSSSRTLSGLGAGEYRFELYHADYPACPCGTATASLTEPAVLGMTEPAIAAVSCTGGSDGSIAVQGAGDVLYTYSVSGQSSRNSSTTENFSGLTAGDYAVTVKRAINGCSDSTFRTVTIAQPATLPTVSIEAIDALCHEENTASDDKYRGSVKAKTASGGTPGYLYKLVAAGSSWTAQDLDFGASSSFATELGAYKIIVRDANGCATESAPATVSSPTKLILAKPSASAVICKGELSLISLSASGGTPPYTFKHDGAAFPAETSLPAGQYFISATDGKGCGAEYPDILEITEPDELVPGISEMRVPSCHDASDGKVVLSAYGGAGGYLYRHESGAYGASNVFEGLSRGVHRFFVKDNRSCERDIQTTLEAPAKLEISMNEIKHVSCAADASGRISVAASGGDGNYGWYLNGDTHRHGTGAAFVFEGLSAGKYFPKAVDGKGCLASMEEIVENLDDFRLTVSAVQPECLEKSDGSIRLSATGGSPNYSFKIHSDDYEKEDLSSSTFSADGLRSGTYACEVRDRAGCAAVGEIVLDYTSTLNLSVDLLSGTPCVNVSEGSTTLSATGGAGGYEYSLDGGEWQSSPHFSGLGFGEHLFTVRDAGACRASVKAETPLTNVLHLEIASASSVACESAKGTIELSAEGGFGIYEYSVDNGELQGSSRFENLSLGEHFFLLRDASGCEVSATGSIELEDVLSATVIETKGIPCESATAGEVELSASGGSGVYEYRVDGGEWQSSSRFTSLRLGEHLFEINDGEGCTATASEEIIIENPVSVLVADYRDVPCAEASSGFALLTASGGRGKYIYGVDGSETGEAALIDRLDYGSHVFFVRDSLGCQATVEHEISLANPVQLSTLERRGVPCRDSQNGFVVLEASGGLGDYLYAVDGGAWTESPRFEGLTRASYFFAVRDASGCEAATVENIPVENPVEIAVAAQGNVPCETARTAFVEARASGGSGVYRFGIDDGEAQESTRYARRRSI